MKHLWNVNKFCSVKSTVICVNIRQLDVLEEYTDSIFRVEE
jgi:hypothetical protein